MRTRADNAARARRARAEGRWKATDPAKYRHWMRIVRRFKTFKGCAYCGYRDDHRALEYHHVDGPGVSPGECASAGRARVRRELEKCIVLCANCHRIETLADRGIE